LAVISAEFAQHQRTFAEMIKTRTENKKFIPHRFENLNQEMKIYYRNRLPEFRGPVEEALKKHEEVTQKALDDVIKNHHEIYQKLGQLSKMKITEEVNKRQGEDKEKFLAEINEYVKKNIHEDQKTKNQKRPNPDEPQSSGNQWEFHQGPGNRRKFSRGDRGGRGFRGGRGDRGHQQNHNL